MAESDIYRQYIIDLYKNPVNYGKLARCNRRAEASNPLCGDEITVYVREADGKIAGISFEGQGCAISRAASCVATELVKGKTVKEALAISDEQVISALGVAVSAARLKCALLGISTIRAALSKVGAGRVKKTGRKKQPA